MISICLFSVGTLLLSLNGVRLFGFSLSDTFFGLALLVLLLELFILDRSKLLCFLKNVLIFPALGIIIGSLLSLFQAHNIRMAIVETIQLFFVITIFVSMIWVYVKRGNVNEIVTFFILSGVVAAVVALFDWVTGSNIGQILSGSIAGDYWGRYSGPLGHPNKFGFYLVLSTSLTLVRWIRQRTIAARVFFVFWLMQIIGILLSGSVTAFIGVFISHALIIINDKRIKRMLTIVLPVLIPILIIASFVISIRGDLLIIWLVDGISGNINRVTSITASTRVDTYLLALDQIIENPFVGKGFDQISTSGLNESLRMMPSTIHNVFLQIFYAGGVIAFLSVLIVYGIVSFQAIYVFIAKKRSNLLKAGLAATVIALIVMDQFQDSIYQREKWLIIGLLTGMYWEEQGVSQDEISLLG